MGGKNFGLFGYLIPDPRRARSGVGLRGVWVKPPHWGWGGGIVGRAQNLY